MRLRLLPFGLAAALLACAGAASAAPGCAPAKDAARDAEAVVRGWFAAGARDDVAAEADLQAPGFYAFDAGKRFDGTALGELVKSAHASGVKIEWNLQDMDVHAACDQAWAAWVNRGASGKAGAMQPVTWLESAVLGYHDGRWRLEFLHSARVPPPP
ncbi:hypothetical protein [Phenylobacterium sp.]|uniref:hypothetical protein n=1 Tax=Phenylobacterium sp. TaxID=1871053 RepID=UPI00356B2613